MPACDCPGCGKTIDMDGFISSRFFLSECGKIYTTGKHLFDLVEVPVDEFDVKWIGKNYLRKDAGKYLDAGVFLPIYLWSGYQPDPSVALSKIESMVYPGRLIVSGMDKSGNKVVFYAITGRSESSQARRLKNLDEAAIVVDVTNQEILAKGDPALLVYNAVSIKGGYLVVSNGAQTDPLSNLILESVESGFSADQIYQVFREFRENRETFQMKTKDGRIIDLASFEPDDPNWTPRISSILGQDHFVMDIVAKGTNKTQNNDFGESEVRCGYKYYPGIGRLVATYAGDNIDPLPSFYAYPIMLNIPWTDLSEATHAIYDALAPEEGHDDFRVSVAGVRFEPGAIEFAEVCIINRHDL